VTVTLALSLPVSPVLSVTTRMTSHLPGGSMTAAFSPAARRTSTPARSSHAQRVSFTPQLGVDPLPSSCTSPPAGLAAVTAAGTLATAVGDMSEENAASAAASSSPAAAAAMLASIAGNSFLAFARCSRSNLLLLPTPRRLLLLVAALLLSARTLGGRLRASPLLPLLALGWGRAAGAAPLLLVEGLMLAAPALLVPAPALLLLLLAGVAPGAPPLP
jgi:hypothetical protein